MRVELHPGFAVDLEPDTDVAREDLGRVWPAVRDAIAEDAVELQSNYTDCDPSPELVAQVWGSMQAPAIRWQSEASFELACTFAWQQDGDDHDVTFLVEDGQSQGCSIDG